MERVKPTEVSFNGTKVVVVLGDIVEQEVDAVVNAANERLKGGSGVDWAIHNAAGWDQLQAACVGRSDFAEQMMPLLPPVLIYGLGLLFTL